MPGRQGGQREGVAQPQTAKVEYLQHSERERDRERGRGRGSVADEEPAQLQLLTLFVILFACLHTLYCDYIS